MVTPFSNSLVFRVVRSLTAAPGFEVYVIFVVFRVTKVEMVTGLCDVIVPLVGSMSAVNDFVVELIGLH